MHDQVRTKEQICEPDQQLPDQPASPMSVKGQFPSRSMEQAEAEKRMRDINVAYSVLSKPLSRTSYDEKLNGRACSQTQLDPEHCSTCGNLTGHWQGTLRKVALCPACMSLQ